MSPKAAAIDVRTIAPRERHPLIFASFDRLAPNESLELVNDHDPAPLRLQFDNQFPGGFSWEYLERGPEIWRVSITRKANMHSAGSCCGSCGGA